MLETTSAIITNPRMEALAAVIQKIDIGNRNENEFEGNYTKRVKITTIVAIFSRLSIESQV